MKFSFDRKDDYVIIKLDDTRLDSLAAPETQREIEQLKEEGFKNMIMDLGSVAYTDSTGLGTFITGDKICKEEEGRMIFAAMQPMVSKVVRITGLDRVLTIADSVEEAEKML